MPAIQIYTLLSQNLETEGFSSEGLIARKGDSSYGVGERKRGRLCQAGGEEACAQLLGFEGFCMHPRAWSTTAIITSNIFFKASIGFYLTPPCLTPTTNYEVERVKCARILQVRKIEA